ncbi:hypothetical protein Sango_1180800 [Sesamum angolense]|uniref:Uncharacterized protein n=1 Tax=Sesamum angolense TaxID=2727404 RepID=A0AAE1WW84_9LAMI|nr:hypothetical protein Sango_1180800 [Sesamum angolense]
MRINSSPIPFFLIILTLSVHGRLSACRVITNKATTTFDFHSPSSWYSPQPAPKESRNDDEWIYRVSRRKTPAGPNPLHN